MSLKKGYHPMIFGTFLDVNGCSKVCGGVLRRVFAWSFSMLSRWGFLMVDRPDCGHYSLGNVDGVESDE
jgi:hypothetical protein